jgi:hypothetical protein
MGNGRRIRQIIQTVQGTYGNYELGDISKFVYTSLNMVIPELNKLKYMLQSDESDCLANCLPTLKEDLIASIDRRWPEYESSRIYAIATFVDLRYKECGFSDDSAAALARSLVLNEINVKNLPV